MAKKQKFKPVITRVKLNPEQAVLSCSCYSGFRVEGVTTYDTGYWSSPWCAAGGAKVLRPNPCKGGMTVTQCRAVWTHFCEVSAYRMPVITGIGVSTGSS